MKRFFLPPGHSCGIHDHWSRCVPAPALVVLLVLALFLALWSGTTRASDEPEEGQLLLDWSCEAPGAQPGNWVGDVLVGRRGQVEMTIVDDQTEPRTPFPGGKPALYVKAVSAADETAIANIWAKPYGIAPMKGWIQFEFMFEDGSIALRVFNGSLASGTRFDQTALGDELFTVLLRPQDGSVGNVVRVRPYATGHQDWLALNPGPRLESGVPYKFRMHWDFTAESPTVRFEIDGGNIGDPVEFHIHPDAATTGIDTFNINGTGFLGEVFASQE